MLQLIPARGTSPAFCYHHNSRLIPLTKAAFILKFRELLVHAHVPSAVRYTGHSFRRGGATYAFRSGFLVNLFRLWVIGSPMLISVILTFLLTLCCRLVVTCEILLFHSLFLSLG